MTSCYLFSGIYIYISAKLTQFSPLQRTWGKGIAVSSPGVWHEETMSSACLYMRRCKQTCQCLLVFLSFQRKKKREKEKTHHDMTLRSVFFSSALTFSALPCALHPLRPPQIVSIKRAFAGQLMLASSFSALVLELLHVASEVPRMICCTRTSKGTFWTWRELLLCAWMTEKHYKTTTERWGFLAYPSFGQSWSARCCLQ